MMVAGSYGESIDRFADLQAATLRNDSHIKMQEKHAEVYERTIAELHAERRAKLSDIENIDRLRASTQQQANQLKEDISTAEQFASCFKTRSILDAQDDDPDLHEDAEARKLKARAKAEAARRVQPKMRELVEVRSRRQLHDELTSNDGDNELSRFTKSSNKLVALCQQLLVAHAEVQAVQQQDPSAEPPPLGEPTPQQRLRSVAQRLGYELQQHLQPDEDGLRLGQHATERLAMLRAVPASADCVGNIRAREPPTPIISHDGRDHDSAQRAAKRPCPENALDRSHELDGVDD